MVTKWLGTNASQRVGPAVSIHDCPLHRLPAPVYDLFQTLAVQLIGKRDEARGTPVKVRLAATPQVGFLMEGNPSGKLTVFVPAPPALSVGALHFVGSEEVERVDASVMRVVNCLTGRGIGSSTLQRPPRCP